MDISWFLMDAPVQRQTQLDLGFSGPVGELFLSGAMVANYCIHFRLL